MFPAARRRGLRRAGRHDAVAPAAARLPSRRPVRPAQGAPGLQPARDARHGARGQGDRGLPGGRAARLRRAAHHARAALAGGRAPPDPRGAGGADRRHVRRRRQAPAPLLALHRPGVPARRADALGAGHDRPLRALLPHRRRRSSPSSPGSPGPTRRVVLASDHGFGPTRDVFHVNAWLEQQGYLAWADGDGRRRARRHAGRLQGGHAPRPRARLVAHDRLRGDAEQPGHPHRRAASRAATTRCPTTSGAASATRSPPGCSRCAARTTARRSSRGCGRATRPSPARTRASARTSRSCSPTAGRCRSCPRPSSSRAGRSRAGHHREVGMFLAAGPGIRAGAKVGELSIVDIAPLLLHRLGLPVPDDVAGRVPVEVFEDAELAARPPRTAPAASAGRRGRGAARQPRARPRGAGRRHAAPQGPGVRGVSEGRSLSSGLTLHYQQVGEGPDVVMVHGITGNLAVWHLQLVPALMSTRSACSPTTCAGTGYSDTPPTGYSLDDMAERPARAARRAGARAPRRRRPQLRGRHRALPRRRPPRARRARSIAIEAALPAMEQVRDHDAWIGWTYWVRRARGGGRRGPAPTSARTCAT